MDKGSRVQILVEAFCLLEGANALGKSMTNYSISSDR